MIQSRFFYIIQRTPFTSFIDARGTSLTVFISVSCRSFIVFNSVMANEGLADGELEDDGLILDDGEREGLID